jgi:uncharacterized HAD superfamily protein
VGVDIDNTINDISRSIARFLDVCLGIDTEPLLKEHFRIDKVAQWTDEQVENFFERYGRDIHSLADFKDPYTPDILKGLYLRFFNMHAITSRKEELADQTKAWFSEMGILDYFKSIHFVNGSKLDYCKENALDITVMVEDDPERAQEFLDGEKTVVLFDYPYNRHLEHPNLIRVKNWWEAYQVLIDLERKEFNKLI